MTEEDKQVFKNHCTPCHGAEPTLRVRELLVYNTLVPHVEYTCRKCGFKGGPGVTEDEAYSLWEQFHS